MKTNVIVNLQFEGIHNWPGCPFEEVRYLRDPHRHMFHICCKKEVAHDDRDVEIIMLKHEVQKYLRDRYLGGHLGSLSCEMLAKELLGMFGLVYCSVLEDNENGAEVSR